MTAIEEARPIEAPSAWFAELAAGPAFATYGAIDSAGVAEHLATSGSYVAVGVGYGFELPRLRIDAGLRLQHFRIEVRGAYDKNKRDDAFEATFDYVFPTASGTVTSKLRGSRVNVYGGLSLGTATFISDRRGESTHVRQLPVFGTFEGGLLLAVSEGIDLRGGISWLAPFGHLNVIAPALGVRARF